MNELQHDIKYQVEDEKDETEYEISMKKHDIFPIMKPFSFTKMNKKVYKKSSKN